jgi:hypothetical protein
VVDIRCFDIRSSITGNVSEAQIVGKNENYIGGFGRPLALLEFSTYSECDHSSSSAAK